MSPETLTILGNSAGRAGGGIVYFVLGAALIHGFTVGAYKQLSAHHPGPFGEVRLIKKAFGPIAGLLSPGIARITIGVCGSTALLATAGYAFNEVFVRWFPNLGFSFCLLGGLLLINLAGVRVAGTAQMLFVGLAFSALLFLSIAGLFGFGNPLSPSQGVSTSWMDLKRVILASLLVFVGFDLAAGCVSENKGNPVKAFTAAIVLAGIVFSCWGWVSAVYVPPDKLTETSIPHVKAARAVLGQEGRFLMGVIVLSGAAAAVNALLMAVSRMMAVMAADGLLPPFLASGKDKAMVGILILVAAVAAMLGSGMAGAEVLEVYIKAGLCFWFLHYAMIHGALLCMGMRSFPGTPMSTTPSQRLFSMAGLAVMTLTFIGLIVAETEWGLLLRIMAVLLFAGLAFSVFWVRFSRKKGWLNKPRGENLVVASRSLRKGKGVTL